MRFTFPIDVFESSEQLRFLSFEQCLQHAEKFITSLVQIMFKYLGWSGSCSMLNCSSGDEYISS